MTVKTILATAESIRILPDAPIPADSTIRVIAFSPILADELEPLAILTPTVEQDAVVVPRYAAGRDGVCLSYAVQVDDELLEGVQYVETMEGAPRNFPYPVVDTKKPFPPSTGGKPGSPP